MMLAPGRDRTSRGKNAGAQGQRNGASSRYEVQERVGQSTLWIAYRARERATGQPVLLKALKGAFNKHPRFTESLFETGEQLLSISHPNLATLYEIGREEGSLYIATEWLAEGSLETRLQRAPLPVGEIMPPLLATTAALAHLHAHGLVHGDLRPRQVLCGEEGVWKLTDVGTAQAFASAGMATADAQPEAAYYLAPERTLGAGPSPASDVYAVGVILYRMLAGRVPFDGPSPLAIALRHRTDAVLHPTQLNTRADGALSDLVVRLLDKNPDARPDASSLYRELKGGPTSRPAPTRPTNSEVAPSPSVPAPPPAVTPPAPAAPPAAVPDPAPASTADTAPRRRTDPVLPAPAPAPPPDMKTLRKRHLWREFRGMLLGIIFLLVMLGGFVGLFVFSFQYWVRDTPPEIHVPKYLYMRLEDATDTLAAKGLTIKVGKEVFNTKNPPGTILSGDPAPGKLIRAPREIVVTISQGERPLEMYNFEGLTLTQVRKIILQHGLRLGQIVEVYDNDQPEGYICGQVPEAGQMLKRRQPITLTVSRGPQPKDVDAEQDPLAGSMPDATALPDEKQFSTEEIDPAATPTASPEGQSTLVSRAAVIKVAVPSDGPSQVVRIVVRDHDGERTVYQKRRRPGDVVARKVRVKRAQDDKATVRVYVGETLTKEQSF